MPITLHRAMPGNALSGPIARAAELLSQLRSADADVLRSLAEMGRVTARPAGDKYDYTRARFAISQASIVRWTLVMRICDYLIPRVSTSDSDTLRRLHERQSDTLRRFKNHLERWSSRDVADDWQGYRAASRALQRRNRRNVEDERRLLYPLLERYGGA